MACRCTVPNIPNMDCNRTCSDQSVSVRLPTQGSPIHSSARREWNQITGDVFPLVGTEQNVSIVELLSISARGKCIDISRDLIQTVQDGILLSPHFWNGRNLWLHSHQLVHHGMNPSSQGENIQVPSDKAGGQWRLSFIWRSHWSDWRHDKWPCTGFPINGAPSVHLQVAVPNWIDTYKGRQPGLNLK